MAQHGGGYMPPPAQQPYGRGPPPGPPSSFMPPAPPPGPPAAGGYAPGAYPPSSSRPPMAPTATAAAGGPPRQSGRPAANGVPLPQGAPPAPKPGPPHQQHPQAGAGPLHPQQPQQPHHHPQQQQQQVGFRPLRAHLEPLQERLRRDTPFLCNVRFHNDLPEIPSDPKLLLTQPDAAQMSAFFLTTEERDVRRGLLQSGELGVHVGLLDLERWSVPEGQPAPMEEADQQLVTVCQSLLTNGRTSKVKRSSSLDVNWLMRTTYIASAEGGNAAAAADRARSSKAGARAGADVQPVDEEGLRLKQIADIEATFEAARVVPQHPNPAKRHLTPMAVLPVLPDFAKWPDKFVNVQFDSEPGNECAELAALPPDVRRQLLERSMLKTFTAGQENSKLMALLLPKQALAEAAAGEPLRETLEASDMEGAYEWALEYRYELEQYQGVDAEAVAAEAAAQGKPSGQDKYLLQMYEDAVTYCPLDGLLKLRKRPRHHDEQQPEEARMLCRELTEREVRIRYDRSLEQLVEEEESLEDL